MPKSSRHRSSKHSSRDARDYSDSDNDSSPKERRGGSDDAGGGGARASKDSGFSDKRKIDLKDSKDLYGSGNGEYAEDHGGSSKRRKEKASDRVSDRWNGGSEEGSSKVKTSSESKSRRRDEESEDVKRSSKSEIHRESSRKEGRDSDRKERDGRGDKSTDNEDIATDSKTGASAESEILEKRSRRKKDNYDSGDVKDKDKHTYSGDDASKSRRKDEKHKDERHRDDRHRDKYREEGDKDSKDRYEKQKDDYSEKDRNGSRSDKYVKSERDTADDRQRKSKPRDSDRDLESGRERDRERDHYRDKDRDHGKDKDRDYDHTWDRDRDHDGDRDRERGRDRERDRDSVREKERDRDLEHDQDRYRDRERDRDRDLDDYSARHKDHRGKKRSPDDRDDYSDSRPRSTKARNSETEKRHMSSSRVEADDRGRSQSHQGHSESTRRRGSPTSSSHGGADEYRLAKEDTKYKESQKESRARAISPLSGPTDRGSKYPSYDRNNKVDDVRAGDFSAERSSSSKASPMGLSERSPSATSLERRNTNRNAARRNLDVEELNRKTATDGRDFPIAEGRSSRDRPIEKPSGDEFTQADSSFHSKPGYSNTSSILAQPPRSAAESSPFPGSEEDSSRGNSNVRFRRNNDSGVGRGGHGNNNNWRGVPNWSSPMPNGFMPFQHGPHGNFQPMLPHFPTPPIFAVRPPMELNQSGMPYHLPDADRYPGHLRPFGWQNMIDASGLPRFHGWDGSGVLRDEPHMYPTPDWDQNRHMMNVRGWETNNAADTWKGHNGDMNMDLSSVSRKEEQPVPVDPANDGSTVQGQGSDKGNSQSRSTEIKQEIHSPVKGIPKSQSSKTSNDAKPDLSELPEGNDGMNLCRAYLSNLDISVELADPESYKQYVGLVDGKQTAIVNERPSVCMILAGFGRVTPQSSGASLSASVFPAVSKSLTQRAIELYRKQRLEPWSIPVAVGGLVDLISSPKKKKLEEESKGPVEKLDEPIPEETPNSGTLIPSNGMEMELVSEPPTDKIPNDSITEEMHSTEGDKPDQGEKVEPMDVESTEEGATTTGSNKVSVPLVVASGEAFMMPDSDESKMVNLSRIQQSPESTH